MQAQAILVYCAQVYQFDVFVREIKILAAS